MPQFRGITTSYATGREPQCSNPILPGYYADPSLVEFNGKFNINTMLDPWSGETLGCWESADFNNWIYRVLNWPTKSGKVWGSTDDYVSVDRIMVK